MVKPLSIFLSVLIVSLLLVILLPVLAQLNRSQDLQVSVTALSSAAVRERPRASSELFQAPQAAASASGDLLDVAGYPGLGQFAAALLNGQAGDVVGVYVRDIMALPVEQQPSGRPEYVATQHNLLTEFSMPKEYGSVGILAHNYLSGSRFPQLVENSEVILVFGTGRIERYRVDHIERFQALKPSSPFSEFIDMNDPFGKVVSSAELFKRIYTTRNQLVLQTCIENQGESSWGRMFVIATPMEPIQLNVPLIDVQANLN
jgi:hypothetical protein